MIFERFTWDNLKLININLKHYSLILQQKLADIRDLLINMLTLTNFKWIIIEIFRS